MKETQWRTRRGGSRKRQMMRMERTVTLGWMSGWSGKKKVHMVVLVEVKSRSRRGNDGSAGPGGGSLAVMWQTMWTCVYM